MRHLVRLAACAGLLAAVASHAQAACGPGQGLGVARVVEVDATGGPVFGSITKRERESSFLGRKEAVLTFDDGPMPGITRSILDTLDRFCTKATFFSVGRMAVAYPETVREVLRRGHTLGTHTWSHPMSLPRLGLERARDQIEAGFAAVAIAAGEPIAPFFRFPGLNDSEALVAHLEGRGIATFTVDVVSNDSYIASSERLIEKTLARLEAEGGGIMLFHDIKPQTARALPVILAEMKTRGYAIVHLVAKTPFVPDPGYTSSVMAHLASRRPTAARSLLALAGRDNPAPAGARGQAREQQTDEGPREAPREPQQPAEPALALPAIAAPPAAAAIAAAPPTPGGPTVAAGATAVGVRIEAGSGIPVTAEAGLPRLQSRRVMAQPRDDEPAAAVVAPPAVPTSAPTAAPHVAAPAIPATAIEPAPTAGDTHSRTGVGPTAPSTPQLKSQPQPVTVEAGQPLPERVVGSPTRPQPRVIAGEYGPAAARRSSRAQQGPVVDARSWRDSYADRMGQSGN